MFGTPGATGQCLLVTVLPIRFADIAVDPATGPERGAGWAGWESLVGHCAAFSWSIKRKIAWPAWFGLATRKAVKSSVSS